jgi:hypothetical protein
MEVLAAVVWLAGFKILNRYAADRRSSSINALKTRPSPSGSCWTCTGCGGRGATISASGEGGGNNYPRHSGALVCINSLHQILKVLLGRAGNKAGDSY